MLIIPSIDLRDGRSRVVHWPGAAAGVGAPTDRPERIAERFVELGARQLHLVDLDGARAGEPINTAAIGSIAARVAVPLQVAGGVESGDAIRRAFAAGATRIVVGMAIVDDPTRLAGCLAVAGDWLAVGLDARPERWAAYPWRRPAPPTLPELAGELVGRGVRRVVLSHGGTAPDPAVVTELTKRGDLDVLIAGGVSDLATVKRLRDGGVTGIILGEALLSGAVDFSAALEAAA